MSKHLNLEQKSEVITWKKSGKSIRQISKITDISKSTVARIIKNSSIRSSNGRKNGTGRKKKLSFEIKNIISKEIDKDPKISSVKITSKIINNTEITLSRKSTYNYIKSLGYVNATASKKPLLTINHKLKRMDVAKEWLYWSKEKWESIIFSDESKFNLRGSDGIVKIWRKQGERLLDKNIQKTVKYGGGGIMVWGCFSAKGVGNLVLIDEIMDRFVYVDILTNNLYASAQKMGLEKFYFQQDNDPKHTSKYAKEFFIRNEIPVISWPSQSPDLNPIENIWAYIERKLKEKIITSKSQLFEAIVTEWNAIPTQMIKNLIKSMKYRTRDVIRAKGGHIDY